MVERLNGYQKCINYHGILRAEFNLQNISAFCVCLFLILFDLCGFCRILWRVSDEIIRLDFYFGYFFLCVLRYLVALNLRRREREKKETLLIFDSTFNTFWSQNYVNLILLTNLLWRCSLNFIFVLGFFENFSFQN